MLITGLVKMSPALKPAITQVGGEHYEQLIHNVFQPYEPDQGTGKVIAFMAASAGAGASYVVREIGHELSGYGDKRIAVVAAEKLQAMEKKELERWLLECAKTDTNLFFIEANLNPGKQDKSETVQSEKNSSGNHRRTAKRRRASLGREECLRLLRGHFDYILIDCQSAESSCAIIALAKPTDGVVIVAAAGETRRGEIERARQVVEMARGKILGFVLNKRRYPIPNWLYKRL